MLPEVGALVAVSSRADFAAAMAADPKVAEVSENLELQMIPSPEKLSLAAADQATAGMGPVEPPGDDSQTGPDPFYPFQWDKKRMRAWALLSDWPADRERTAATLASAIASSEKDAAAFIARYDAEHGLVSSTNS